MDNHRLSTQQPQWCKPEMGLVALTLEGEGGLALLSLFLCHSLYVEGERYGGVVVVEGGLYRGPPPPAMRKGRRPKHGSNAA